MFSISNTEDLTTKDFQPYMFQVVPNTGIESRGLAQFFAVRNYKRFYLGPDYGMPELVVELQVQPYQAKTRMHRFYPSSGLNLAIRIFLRNIPRIIADKPEIVVTNLWGESLAKFMRQAKAAGLLDSANVTSLFDLDMLRSMGPEMPEGLLGYRAMSFLWDRERRMKQFADRFYSKYQQWPADWAIMAYDGLVALTEAIQKANSTDSDQVVKALEGLSFKSLRGARYIRAGRSHGQCRSLRRMDLERSQVRRLSHYEERCGGPSRTGLDAG